MAVRALLLSLAVVAAGCGGGGDENAAPERTETQTSTEPASLPAKHFGYIKRVSTVGPPTSLAFDEAEFLTGSEAQKQAEEDGFVAPGESVPNDYYVRNPDQATRTLRIANDAKITAKRCSLCRHGRPGELRPFLAAFTKGRHTYGDPYRGSSGSYWLTIEDGEVVAIDEQYIP